MDGDSIIGMIELSSIIIAGGLGIAGAITDTKDDKGRLTKWGIIAVAGIIISNSFSFIQSYLQQQRDQEEQIASYERDRVRDSLERVKYLEQMQLLYANINKADSSLKQQFYIQSQARSVLSQVDRSIGVQNRIFQQSEVLNEQQKAAADNIDRTLNPLFPFRIDLSFWVQVDSGHTELTLLTQLLMHKVSTLSADGLAKEGLYPVSSGRGDVLLITSGNINYDVLINILVRQQVSMTFARGRGGRRGAVTAQIPDGFLRNRANMQGVQILYRKEPASYHISMQDLPLKVVSDSGGAFNSTKDLPGARLEFGIREAFGPISALEIDFKFPPDFSRISRLKKNGWGTNKVAAGRGTHSFQYVSPSLAFE